MASPEVNSICRIIIGVANTIGMPLSKWPTVCSTGTTSVRSALRPIVITSRASMMSLYPREPASDQFEYTLGWVNFHLGAVRNGRGDVLVEARKHGDIAERRALRQDRIDRIEHQRERHDAARFHLMQHPGGGDATFGGIKHQDLADIGLASKLVRGAAEHALDSVEVVARGKTVARNQRGPAHDRPHGVAGLEYLRAHVRTSFPLTAASTQASIEASIGR